MAVTPSNMLPLGTPAPDFALPDIDGNVVTRETYKGNPLLVMFICNHCPFVIHVAGELASATVGASACDTPIWGRAKVSAGTATSATPSRTAISARMPPSRF